MEFCKGNMTLDRHADLAFMPALVGDLTGELDIIHRQTGLGYDRIIGGAKGHFNARDLTLDATIYV